MSNEVLADDDFIPDFELDGTEVKEDDLKDGGAGVSKQGYYHLELMSREMVKEEGKARNLSLTMKVLEGEHKSEIGKVCWHRMYLEKNEYEMTPDGKPVFEDQKGTRKDGTEYDVKKKTGKILPLVAGDKVIAGHGRFCVGLGLLTDDQIAGKKFNLPLSAINPGLQFIAKVNGSAQINFNQTFPLDSEEMKDIPKNEEALLVFAAGSAGINDDAVSAI